MCAASWRKLRAFPASLVAAKPETSRRASSCCRVALGERRERLTWAAAARPYFTFMPAELPSAFRGVKFRHQSELSKKFRFHVSRPQAGTLTDSAHVTTTLGVGEAAAAF